MKKLMVAAAIICAAALSHGASLYWGGAASDPNGVDALAVGAQAALLYSDSAFSGDATSVAGWEVGGEADNGGTIVQLHTLTSTEVDPLFAFTETYTVEGGSVDGNYAVLVLNPEGNAASYYYLGSVTGTTGASNPTDLGVNMDWSGSEYVTSGGYTVAVKPATPIVPEPTTYALVGLAAAALALRKRFRK